MMRFFLTLFILLLVGSSIVLNADETGRKAAATQELELSAISFGEPLTELAIRSSGRMEAWEVPAFERSAPLRYSGSRELVFFRKAPGAGAESDEAGSVVATVTLPEQGRRWLLLFLPVTDGSSRVFPIADGSEGYPLGAARFFNATAAQLAIKAGGDSFILEPGQMRIVAGDGKKISMIVAVPDGNGSWKIATSTVLRLRNQERRSIFFTRSDAEFFQQRNEDGEFLRMAPVQVFSVIDPPVD